jgi:hypothetical protein
MPGCLYLYYSGFDPAWGKYGVATTIVAEAIKYAISAGVPRVHLSMGVDVAKSRWGPTMPVRYEGNHVRARLTSRAAFRLYTGARGSKLVQHLLPLRRFD